MRVLRLQWVAIELKRDKSLEFFYGLVTKKCLRYKIMRRFAKKISHVNKT